MHALANHSRDLWLVSETPRSWTGPSDSDWKDVAAFHTYILGFDWQQYLLMMMMMMQLTNSYNLVLRPQSLICFTLCATQPVDLCFCRQGRWRGWVVSWQTLCFHWRLCASGEVTWLKPSSALGVGVGVGVGTGTSWHALAVTLTPLTWHASARSHFVPSVESENASNQVWPSITQMTRFLWTHIHPSINKSVS